MATIETLMTELYETLLQLRYPGIAQVTSEDIEETVLRREDRLFLLSWLLTQSSLVPSNEFSGDNNAEKLVKWYTDMGICTNADALLGKVSIKEQVPTLRNLLMYSKNVLMEDQPVADDPSSAMDIFKKHIGESNNIIPPNCSLSSKLNYNETIQYLSTRRKSLSDRRLSDLEPQANLHKCQSSSEIFRSKGNSSGSSQESDVSSAVEKFVEAFESVSTWQSSSNGSATPLTNSMDSRIENIHSNMRILKETMRAKEEVSRFVIEDSLKKGERPLDGIIEDIVIRLEEFTNADSSNSSL